MNKVIFVNRFYRPDHSATAQLLTDLAEWLVRHGFSVSVISCRQSYEDPNANLPAHEMLDGVAVYRVWTSRFGRRHLAGRAIDYLSFYLACLVRLLMLARRGDIIVAKTDPPMLSVIGAIAAKLKRAALVNWIQDLFPEIAKEIGIGFLDSRVFELLRAMRNWSLRCAHKNIVLGTTMKSRVNLNSGHPDKTSIIHNWVVRSELKPISREDNPLRREWHLDGKLVVGYSGNLGRAHDYQTLHQAALSLRDRADIVFLVVGSGAGYTALQTLARESGLSNLIFKPYQPLDKLNDSLAAADVHLVSLTPGLEGLIVPSKTYGILAVGRPIVYIGDYASELSQLLHRGQCGITVAPGDATALTRWLEGLLTGQEHIDRISANAYSLYLSEFAYGRSLNDWRDALRQILPA